jgi:hypothetical protein
MAPSAALADSATSASGPLLRADQLMCGITNRFR